MRQVIAARIPKYYDVIMYECQPIDIIHDEYVYEFGRWYVTCGGEGEYFNSNREACAYFVKMHLFAANEALTNDM